MKTVHMQLMTLILIVSTVIQQTTPQLPVGAICVPKSTKLPTAIEMLQPLKGYVALSSSCNQDDLQKGCDRYASLPGFGPATAQMGVCKTFTSKDELVGYLKDVLEGKYPNFKFAGTGGYAVLCKTRLGKVQYAKQVKTCDTASQAEACDTAAGIADPVSCTRYPTDYQLTEFLNSNAQINGLECKLSASGTAFRALVGECSVPIANFLCGPKLGVLKTCTFISNDPAARTSWLAEFYNKAMVTCKIKDTGNTYKRPARDCDTDTQRSACPIDSTDPVGCNIYNTKAEMAASLAP